MQLKLATQLLSGGLRKPKIIGEWKNDQKKSQNTVARSNKKVKM